MGCSCRFSCILSKWQFHVSQTVLNIPCAVVQRRISLHTGYVAEILLMPSKPLATSRQATHRAHTGERWSLIHWYKGLTAEGGGACQPRSKVVVKVQMLAPCQ